MCNVCVASTALNMTHEGTFATFARHQSSGRGVDVQAKGCGAEHRPARYRLRRTGGRWTAWEDTTDLAGVMGRLGLDMGWHGTPQEVQAWVGGGPLAPVLAIARGEQHGTRRRGPRALERRS